MQRWFAAAARSLFAGRLAALRAVLLAFLAWNALLRIVLAVADGDLSLLAPWRLVPALAIGALFDAGVATFAAPLLALVLWAWPPRFHRALRFGFGALLLPLAGAVAFVGAAELVFWNEFESRFNFIAVDYLVYTSEVIGNIRESYDLPLAFAGIAAAGLALWALTALGAFRALSAPAAAPRFPARALAAWLLAPLVAYGVMDPRLHEISGDTRVNELAGNGWFEFCHAFWANEIDYERFYRTIPIDRARATLAAHLSPAPAAPARPFERDVANAGPEKRLNVVLVSIESLGADFLRAFGCQEPLMPNLDRLADEGLLFTQVYATGTRTVRGLEALSLSVPPTPGHSIVKRPGNGGLFTAASVFRDKGYESLFLYGGYGYFDNMNAFFGGNGYTVVDRNVLRPDQIHYENIWGVADEDLFDLTVRELDRRHAEGRPFFAHVMTTSNHRPFTYPEGRIDIPPHTGRKGGVKYTDWAIGHFVEEARKRPWFDDTVFVFVADHTHTARGRQDLPVANYHIPLVVWSPRHLAPRRVDTLASQIDVIPTVLGLLDWSYHSKFFGQDILREGKDHPRALLANYQTVGLYEDGAVVELKPNRRVEVVDAETGAPRAIDARAQALVDEAIAYYEVGSRAYRAGDLREESPPPAAAHAAAR